MSSPQRWVGKTVSLREAHIAVLTELVGLRIQVGRGAQMPQPQETHHLSKKHIFRVCRMHLITAVSFGFTLGRSSPTKQQPEKSQKKKWDDRAGAA